MHAGIYYKPNSLKAKVCIDGSKRLINWAEKKGIQINKCGKVISPSSIELDKQIDKLYERGRLNGADVEIIDEKKFKKIIPDGRTASGRALWSPNTAVINPRTVLHKLKDELLSKDVKFILGSKKQFFDKKLQKVVINEKTNIFYKHLINCAGLHADKIAHNFDVGLNYKLLPFRGLYWKLKKNIKLNLKTNLYPVPDLKMPFLGVHFTPSAQINPSNVSIGPTAFPAFGRENYRNFKNIEPKMLFDNLNILISQYIQNKGNFRNYAHEQLMLSFAPIMIEEAKKLVPKIKLTDIELSDKVGIRSQLFNLETKAMEDDFLLINGYKSSHVLNAISPAFTASFSLADLVIDKIKFDT